MNTRRTRQTYTAIYTQGNHQHGAPSGTLHGNSLATTRATQHPRPIASHGFPCPLSPIISTYPLTFSSSTFLFSSVGKYFVLLVLFFLWTLSPVGKRCREEEEATPCALRKTGSREGRRSQEQPDPVGITMQENCGAGRDKCRCYATAKSIEKEKYKKKTKTINKKQKTKQKNNKVYKIEGGRRGSSRLDVPPHHANSHNSSRFSENEAANSERDTPAL